MRYLLLIVFIPCPSVKAECKAQQGKFVLTAHRHSRVCRNPDSFIRLKCWLYMRFGRLCQEGIEDGFQQTFATDPDVVYELEEAQVERELLLRDTSVGTQPGA